jgi:carbonic anhydrase/acetyltransferase-like protein (isoleucine patch superfamily)
LPQFEFEGRRPSVHPDAYIAPTATLIGDVRVAAGASVWFGAVLRGDVERIEVGEDSNVQDNAVIHAAPDLPTVIGRRVTVGHAALLEGCRVEAEALVGMGAIVLQRARLGAGSVLGAGAVLAEGREVPAGQFAAGVPAITRGEVSPGAAAQWVGRPAEHYVELAGAYRRGLRALSEPD